MHSPRQMNTFILISSTLATTLSFIASETVPITRNGPPVMLMSSSLSGETPYLTPMLTHKRDADYLEFKDLLNQRLLGNSIEQCPCVKRPGTDKCIAYDPRYQAATLEEAILGFNDLTQHKRIGEDGSVAEAELFACETLECRTCAALLLQRLKEIGFVDTGTVISIPLPETLDSTNCKRHNFMRVPNIPQAPPPPEHVRKLIENGKKYAMAQRLPRLPVHYEHANMTSQTGVYRTAPQPVIRPIRNPSYVPSQYYRFAYSTQGYPSRYFLPPVWRSAQGTKIYMTDSRQTRRGRRRKTREILGQRGITHCIQRGELDDNEQLSLCASCWTWRKLPADYFPRFVNELICLNGDNDYCLSGWGTCQQHYKPLYVLKKVNGEHVETTISSAICCNCRVRPGNELHSLVIGEL